MKISTLHWMTCGAASVSLSVAADSAPQPEPPLRDKTLVVWVAPANTTQRGGSALTVEDGSDHFDAIVLGELASGKWMAGSDFYRRTAKQQAKAPAETAAPDVFVQVAITYSGRQVSIFRNGQPYFSHTMDSEPQEFGPVTTAGLGKRHRRQSDGAHFAGMVDDARIYSQALTAEQLAALKPNEPSAIQPWAWWNFNDAEGKDLTGRFRGAKLTGGAKIADGRLILDGRTGDCVFRPAQETPFAAETPARPSQPPADWLSFHLAHPGPGNAMPGDPNCAFFWKDRYHLHYIYTHREGFSFAHVSSTDLLHWKWHPTTLTPPKTGHGMFSGTGFFTKEGRPAIIYHGEGSGRNQIAVSLDDDLERWSDPSALEPNIPAGLDGSKIAHWDPDAWISEANYYAISGGSPGSGKPPTLFKSADLKSWDYLGNFLTRDMPDVRADEDISCPNFFKIGGRDMLLCISHTLGCRYYLGEWKNEKFTPAFHARMNWHGWDFFAPESVLAPDGRRIMWAWCNVGFPQSGIQSLPREISLPEDGVLRIKPLRELESLRHNERSESNLPPSGGSSLLSNISGDALELLVQFEPHEGGECGLEVHCDAAGNAGFPISVDPAAKTLSLGAVKAPFTLQPGETLTLHVFIDKSMIEVFANDQQAMVASHRCPAANDRIRLVTKGAAKAAAVKAWNLHSIY